MMSAAPSAGSHGGDGGGRRPLLDDKAFGKVERFAGGEVSYADWAYDIKMAVVLRWVLILARASASSFQGFPACPLV